MRQAPVRPALQFAPQAETPVEATRRRRRERAAAAAWTGKWKTVSKTKSETARTEQAGRNVRFAARKRTNVVTSEVRRRFVPGKHALDQRPMWQLKRTIVTTETIIPSTAGDWDYDFFMMHGDDEQAALTFV